MRTRRFDEYHCYSDDPLMFGNCVWRAREFDDWNPTADDGGPRFFFSVVQESVGIEVDAIEAKLEHAGILRAHD